MAAINSFFDLEAWKESHKLALLIYKFTEAFPSSEKFGLTNQPRRAAVSVTSNIAEGFSRNSSKEKVQFYYMALGSLSEVQSQTILAKDLKWLSHVNFEEISEKILLAGKLIRGIIKSAKTMPSR